MTLPQKKNLAISGFILLLITAIIVCIRFDDQYPFKICEFESEIGHSYEIFYRPKNNSFKVTRSWFRAEVETFHENDFKIHQSVEGRLFATKLVYPDNLNTPKKRVEHIKTVILKRDAEIFEYINLDCSN